EPVGEEALGACGNSRGGAAADGPEAPDPRAPAAPGPPDHRGFPLWGPGREPGGRGEGCADADAARLPTGDPASERRGTGRAGPDAPGVEEAARLAVCQPACRNNWGHTGWSSTAATRPSSSTGTRPSSARASPGRSRGPPRP